MTNPKLHDPAIYSRFARMQGELFFAGYSLSQLKTLAGRTPFYVYSRTLIEQRVSEIRAALPQNVHLSYAIKANPLPQLVSDIAQRVDRLDVASIREMQIALQSGIPASSISFAGPGKEQCELAAAIAAGVIINAESEHELKRIAAIARSLDRSAHIALRINPPFELKSSGMRMGGGSKQFGIDSELIPGLLSLVQRPPFKFHGFHLFAGSQNLNPDSIIEYYRNALVLFAELQTQLKTTCPNFTLGGALGIPYFPGEASIELSAIGTAFSKLLAEYEPLLNQSQLTLELGRYLVGEAGIYVCEVTERKHSRGQNILVTNGGMHHHLSNSGNLGQVLRRNYPVLAAKDLGNRPSEQVTIVGPLCTPLDRVADAIVLPKLEPGDLIAILQSGAYGLTASPQQFLGHPAPMELFL